ncbi:flavin reductase family protein [Cupriavidus basilensis]|uniref:flavin reductase family protein n=1 Tax=Cupriavidus basilensis TaxID=68895 RepID=UPI0028405315|nr:flavin reductase family protein [Cupriavidus basilensis]MDR3381246.1 flavin reductase family protein [Cupriavidus basilensis]
MLQTCTATAQPAMPTPMPASDPAFSARDFRNAMGQFATGVVVISTEIDGEAHAMTANAFMSGSLAPPLVLVSVACTARMHEKIQASGMFAISVLKDAQGNVSQHFAGKPSETFSPVFERLGGLPVIEGAAVRLAAELRHAYPCGDHTLFVGEVKELVVCDQAPAPLLFHSGRYAKLAGSN